MARPKASLATPGKGVDMKALEQQRLMTIDGRQRNWLEDFVVLGVKDMRAMTTDEVIKIFIKGRHQGDLAAKLEDSATPGPVSLRDVIRTLVWQTYLRVLNSNDEPMHGNLRSFWYRIVEPFCNKHKLFKPTAGPDLLSLVSDSSIPLLADLEMDSGFRMFGEGGSHGGYILGLMGKAIDLFVIHGVFSFRQPFDFKDPRENFHQVGAKRPSLLFFTEKEGLWFRAQQYSKQYGISAMASHGEPGLLTIEYFADQLQKRRVGVVHIGALTDYDPWGFHIATSIQDKLKFYGFDVKLERLTSIKLFTEEMIEEGKRDLRQTVSKAKWKEVEEWMRITNGVNGEPYSLHVDMANGPQLDGVVAAWYKEQSRKPM